jgi:ubiquinone/menaquinone biosynthesis C-methylase UbiE
MSQLYKDNLVAHAARSFFWDIVADEIKSDFNGFPIGALLDFGCSYGGFIENLNNKTHVSKCWGVDIDEGCLESCKSRFESSFTFGSPDEIKKLVPNNVLDVVTAIEVLPYIENYNALLALLASKLKPQGVIYALIGMHSDSGFVKEFSKFLQQSGNSHVSRSIDYYVDGAIAENYKVYAKRLDLSRSFGIRLAGQNVDLGISCAGFIKYIYEDKFLLKFVKASADKLID